FRLDIDKAERLKNIVELYGKFNKEELYIATKNLEKRLGGLRLSEALSALENNDFYLWAEILLTYYDDNYQFSSGKRDSLCVVELNQQEFDAYISDEFPKKIHKIYILLGGNQGEVIKNFEKAKMAIVNEIGTIHRSSSVYETAAWGNTNQPNFLNQIVEVYTIKTPHKCMELLLKIEEQLGRVRHEKYDPRTIDLDIILFGNEIINDNQLQIPHPRMNERRFVLTPLNELIPQNIHPQSKQSIAALLKKCADSLPVARLNLNN
ncbi:MAG: 2-amino-4-hydroxy-6-hydroxymethyldihydropteridine diphosphokinase, partial [Bacteroidetes bacterium]|nr:2-amino-4-hydroxy-6-hydroxymethyldihydropteridine diphosphokinase [Bacteroidota bacterium]